MNLNIFLVNGWALKSDFWKPTCELLKKKQYISSAKIVSSKYLSENQIFFKRFKSNNVFVTHSMGLNFFLKNNINCRALINFFSAPSFLMFQTNTKQTKRKLNIMLKKFDYNPDLVLKKFFMNCGLKESYYLKKKFDYKKLKAQLINLRDDNLTQKFVSQESQILTVLSDNDKIFSPCNHSFKKIQNDHHKIMNITGASHAFPLLEPKKTSEIIHNFLYSFR